jgi:hypothetical protein
VLSHTYLRAAWARPPSLRRPATGAPAASSTQALRVTGARGRRVVGAGSSKVRAMATTAVTRRGDLSVTAYYTAHAWRWGKLAGAELFTGRKSRDVFNATNLALGVARLFRRDLPSLRHGLVQRHVMIDRLAAASGCAQVLELAAGLSRRGVTMSADPALRYVEVDLPPMIAHKQRLLRKSARGRAIAARPTWCCTPATRRRWRSTRCWRRARCA